jgi:serine/threonine protein kinase
MKKNNFCLPFCKRSSKKEKVDDLVNYQLVRELKKSNFHLFLVKGKKSKQYVMKVFPFKNDRLPSAYTREAAFTTLSHPNIISFIHCEPCVENLFDGKYPKAAFIVMELALFGDCCDLMREGKLPSHDIVTRTYFHQILNGVEYLHSKGIAHMDLKLENLLLDENCILKITDFDAVCFFENQTPPGRGTRNYRAPELKAKACRDPKAADIYSLGILLFVLKLQSYPYIEEPHCETEAERLMLDNDPAFWDNVKQNSGLQCNEEDFKSLFMSMVRRNPEDRITLEEVQKVNGTLERHSQTVNLKP